MPPPEFGTVQRGISPEDYGVHYVGTVYFTGKQLVATHPETVRGFMSSLLLAGSARKLSLARARELLAVAPPSDDDLPEEPIDARPPCPCCGGHMIIIETFARWSQPRAPPHCTPQTGRTPS